VSTNLKTKTKESLISVLPITIFVLLLHFSIAPLPVDILYQFLSGAILLIAGMTLFSLGVDLSMVPMGEHIGAKLVEKRNLFFLIVVALGIGVMITIAEPNLQVLATQVPSIPSNILIGSVALGVGFFLMIAILRIIFQVRYSYIAIFFYGIIFLLAFFTSETYFGLAFDSGGIATGPITVPVIIALGIGVASVRGGKNVEEDSFGLVGICAMGPVTAVMLLSIFSKSEPVSSAAQTSDPLSLTGIIGQGLTTHASEILLALFPIFLLFVFFQIFFLKLPKQYMSKVLLGLFYTFLGLVLFLTGANIGFLPAGNFLGGYLISLPYRWILIPLGMGMGFFILLAEPSVHVLTKQIKELTSGSISTKALLFSMSIGTGIAVGLALFRVLYQLSLYYFIIPGYAIALFLTFFAPRIFTSIAFDSGGVASGPMTATFLLPLALGATAASGGDMLKDAFGIVALATMMPPIVLQLLGILYKLKLGKMQESAIIDDDSSDDDIIEF
jgi:hypothetical protein